MIVSSLCLLLLLSCRLTSTFAFEPETALPMFVEELDVTMFDSKYISNPLMERSLLDGLGERFGGVTEAMLLSADCVKCFLVYVIDNNIFLQRRWRDGVGSWYQGGTRREEVLAPLYEALNDLKRSRLRMPDTVFLLALGDAGFNMHSNRPVVAFSVSRSRRESPLTSSTVNLLIPPPEMVRPRVVADSFPRSRWLYNFEIGDGNAADDRGGGRVRARVPFGDKRRRAIWRGRPLGPLNHDHPSHIRRVELARYANRFSDVLDAKLTVYRKPLRAKNLLFGSAIPFDRFDQWAIVLDVDGAGWSSTFLHRLIGSSIVMKMESDFDDLVSMAVEPNVHYVPFAANLTDLRPRILDILSWDEARYTSMVNAAHQRFASFQYDDVKQYWVELLVRYTAQLAFNVSVPESVDTSIAYVPCHAIRSEVGCLNRRAVLGMYCRWQRDSICVASLRPPDADRVDMLTANDGSGSSDESTGSVRSEDESLEGDAGNWEDDYKEEFGDWVDV